MISEEEKKEDPEQKEEFTFGKKQKALREAKVRAEQLE